MPRAEGDVAGSSLERLKGSVREYRAPFEPVSDKDWEVLSLEDDADTSRGGA